MKILRRLFYEVHLWLGITSGILLSIICLSGAIFVFYPECQYLAEPSKFCVDVPKNAVIPPVDNMIEKLENECAMRVVEVTIPQSTNRAWFFRLVSESGGQLNGERIYVNPYNGETTGTASSPVDPFFYSVRNLHRFLWLSPSIGRPLVGWVTVAFLVTAVSGLVLWLPRTLKCLEKVRLWLPGLKIRFRKGIWPLIYDLHNTVGFYSLIPLLLLALTGLCWSFSGYRDTLSNLCGETVFVQFQQPSFIDSPEERLEPRPIQELIEKHNRLIPGQGELHISIPRNRFEPVIIQEGSTGFFSLAVKDRTQWDRCLGTVIPIEHYGKTVAVERFSNKPFGAKIAATIRAIHYGEITGLSSKIVFFIACLCATSFPMTGAALWINKLRLRRRQNLMPIKVANHSMA